MFRSTLIGTCSMIVGASAALAEGGQALPPPPPLIITEERCTAAFDCAYIGLEYGRVRGDWAQTGLTTPLALAMEDGDALGVFAGYNWQSGNLLFGGEIRYLSFNDFATAAGLPFEVDNVLDLRARLGFAADRALFYGAVGYSMGDATAPAGAFDIDGFNFGLGAEFNVTDAFFVGVDYTARDMDGTLGAFTYEGDVDTLTLRFGLRF
ncbi:outer membrane protein [Roseicyclus mahoneyensis]|uniref:Opacity protein-like surface antigen n=1 Tax=Roseicyclus mahoneyensis TaxID=164332 RepID=A0A316GN87_9RHOB|nr:outer membrane beta-barrel protein [Roseicyclus mahoneyensis]PWK62620.1 opacity protein-like surface antigen [Roseicyclus mahoneyensis]